ncbi:hypothetical protein ACFFMR_27500 [Micromonospora andamanensis]|uniref:Uncharacterized protein n=1 Tax=Micromonospora andamanensis TaxID=1287068 RepID=A0ABQ4HSS9_9ACTN|nr:hypothetical protein [Micromonospora andamanensis]GIJ08718.1 hypothetical protein Van01_19320 [Micromonospora andamanensis]
MSTGEFSEVDHDLLADYLGGALDGTAEHAEITRLVAQDPAWAHAHARLASAVDNVRAELAGWGEPTLELPPEITDRISAALAAAVPLAVPTVEVAPVSAATEDPEVARSATRGPVAADDPAADEEGADVGSESTGGKTALVPTQPLGGPRRPGGPLRPGQDRTASSRPGPRRRRWARVAGPVALAAAAVVGLGALQLSQSHQGGERATDTALSDRAASPAVPHAYPQDSAGQAGTTTAPERASAAASTPYRVVGPPQRSDTDYTPEALTRVTPSVRQFSSSGDPEVGTQNQERLPAPGDLNRLGDQTALSACLAEISAEHSVGPLVFDVIDYARFQGLPALVLQFTDAAGTSWAWVSGPECGVPGSGSDARYRTRVG